MSVILKKLLWFQNLKITSEVLCDADPFYKNICLIILAQRVEVY